MRAAKVGAFSSAVASSVTSAIPGLGGSSIAGLNVDPSSLPKDGEGEDKKGEIVNRKNGPLWVPIFVTHTHVNICDLFSWFVMEFCTHFGGAPERKFDGETKEGVWPLCQ